MKSIGLLKVELHNLERNAETLERIVYNDLKALESLPDKAADKYEGKVWRKLQKLDELQDAIDATTAELKARGGWEPVSHSGNKYQYNPPKTETPEVTVNGKVRGRPSKRTHYWERVSAAMPEEGGVISVADIVDLLNITKTPCGNLVRHWVSSRKLVMSGHKDGSTVYCRYGDTPLYQTTQVIEAIKTGAVTVKAIAFALGYAGHSSAAVLRTLAELEEQGVVENSSTGTHARYRLTTENNSQEAA